MATQLKSAQTKSFTDLAQDEVRTRVQGIIADIRTRGDAAVRDYSEKFDHWTAAVFR